MRGISWLAKNRLASQDALCSMEWVNEWVSEWVTKEGRKEGRKERSNSYGIKFCLLKPRGILRFKNGFNKSDSKTWTLKWIYGWLGLTSQTFYEHAFMFYAQWNTKTFSVWVLRAWMDHPVCYVYAVRYIYLRGYKRNNKPTQCCTPCAGFTPVSTVEGWKSLANYSRWTSMPFLPHILRRVGELCFIWMVSTDN
jgi:hypothetical protein